MLLLAIDCTFGGHAAALARDGRSLAAAAHPGIHATDGLMGTLERLFRKAGIGLSDLDGIAFAAGPGLFSGIRAACACAQGIAHAAGLRVLAVSSMRAAAASCTAAGRVLVAYPAHGGHCYLAGYSNCGRRQSRPPALHALDSLPRIRGAWQLCGRSLAPIHAGLRRSCGPALQIERRIALKKSLAPAVAQIAAGRWRKATVPEQARPVYVRNKVAYTRQELQAAAK